MLVLELIEKEILENEKVFLKKVEVVFDYFFDWLVV